MKIYLGKTGLDKSFQQPFPEIIKCHQCKGEARIMFVGAEEFRGIKGEYIFKLHENEGEGGYWFHDACAVAVYLCKECFEPNALINQA